MVHVCANGLGERTGNASLEEVAVSLKSMQGGGNLHQIRNAGRVLPTVGGVVGERLHAQKPIMGEITYVRESSLGIDALEKEPCVGYAVHPEFVGRKHRFVLGKKSGKPSIEIRLIEMGMDATDDQMRTMLDQVKLVSIKKKSWLSDEEFHEIVQGVLGN